MTQEYFLEKARSVHGYKYNYPNLPITMNLNTNIDIEFNSIIHTQKVVKHLMGRSPEKNTPKKTTEKFIEEAKKVWGNKYDYSKVVYDGALKPVIIILDGIEFSQIAITHLKGKAPEKNLTQENFIRKSKIKHGNKYDYSLVKFVSGDIPVMIGYNGIFYLQKPYQHLNSCPEKIKLAIRKTTKCFVKESNLVHDFKYIYDKTDYIKNQIKVTITCPIHGDFTQTPLSHIQGNGCPRCNESRGERYIHQFLKKNNINYNRQHKFKDCRNILELPFDFYIPSMRTCIEFDGKQHYEPITHFGGLKAFETLKINDKIKSDYCEENYINLIRIKYDQDVEKCLYENLKELIKIKLHRA